MLDVLKREEINYANISLPKVEADAEEIPKRGRRSIEYGIKQFDKQGRVVCKLYVFNRYFVAFKENRSRERVYDLRFVSLVPENEFRVQWKYVYSAFLSFGLSAIFLLPMVALPFQYWLATLCAIIGFASVTLALSRISKEAVFYTRHGNLVAFRLKQNQPDAKRFESLLKQLSESMKRAQTFLPQNHNALAMEIKEHRRLMEVGTIGKKDYEAAKKKIFDYFSSM